MLIEQLICRFLDYMEVERNYSRGTSDNIAAVVRLLNEQYGKMPVSQFRAILWHGIKRCFSLSVLCEPFAHFAVQFPSFYRKVRKG